VANASAAMNHNYSTIHHRLYQYEVEIYLPPCKNKLVAGKQIALEGKILMGMKLNQSDKVLFTWIV
jgi:hypothetical protein